MALTHTETLPTITRSVSLTVTGVVRFKSKGVIVGVCWLLTGKTQQDQVMKDLFRVANPAFKTGFLKYIYDTYEHKNCAKFHGKDVVMHRFPPFDA